MTGALGLRPDSSDERDSLSFLEFSDGEFGASLVCVGIIGSFFLCIEIQLKLRNQEFRFFLFLFAASRDEIDSRPRALTGLSGTRCNPQRDSM